PATQAKIGIFCQVSQNHLLNVHDVIYHDLLLLAYQGPASTSLSKLHLTDK
ncbi:hypothetical protein DYB37_012770, partial [Aphanomyces astaci]